MDQQELNEDLLRFFKALADANRLKIIGLLANQPYTVEQLATILSLGPSTVSHHLAKLNEAGLVSATADSYYNLYQLEEKNLEEMSKRLLAKDTLTTLVEDVDVNAYDRKVIRDYTGPDGRLKTIPSQRKKLYAILRHMIQDFEMDREYTEKEVNEIISRYHDDYASLRREFIDERFMSRKNGVYRRLTIEKP